MPVFSLRKLKGLAWVKYKLLFDLPEALPDLTLETMTQQQWELLADRCYRGLDWCRLLQLRPDFADRCPWVELDGWDWSNLLQVQRQFTDKCDWKKLDGSNWSYLLRFQPQFADKCNWEKLKQLDNELWDELLDAQPQFADKRK